LISINLPLYSEKAVCGVLMSSIFCVAFLNNACLYPELT
jgi:hypothetical protein